MKLVLKIFLIWTTLNEGNAEEATKTQVLTTSDTEIPADPAELLQMEIEANESLKEKTWRSYPVSGIQENSVYYDQLIAQGWKVHRATSYGTQTPLQIWPNGNVWVMFGCRTTAHNNQFRLAAFTKTADTRRRGSYQARNTGWWSNGVFWYWVPSYSVGFAESSSISENQADTNGASKRMSWHLIQPYGGWRCGNTKGLNSDGTWQKMVMWKSPEPAQKVLKKGQTPPTGIWLRQLFLSNLIKTKWAYTINPNGYYSGSNYNAQTNDNTIWPNGSPKWMFMGCRTKGSDRITLGAFARYKVLAPNGRNHRRRVVKTWEHGTYWYVHPGRSIGFAPTSSISLSSADIQNSYANKRLSWHFPGSGWRCGDVRGRDYNNLQKIVMYWGPTTTTTTTTTTLAKMKVVTWMLPEKMEYRVLNHKNKVICKGGNFNNWYSTLNLGCNLKKGRYILECIDRKGFGWSGGYVQVKNKKLCKKFLWKGSKRRESFTV